MTVAKSSYRRKAREATELEVALANAALRSLDEQRNVIGLAPAPRPSFDGHKIRVMVERNPDWYRHLHSTHGWSRRGSRVKRSRVIKALQRIVESRVRSNGYEARLLEILNDRQEEVLRGF
jgi:hypothetical protein